jgi:anti-anti-sigma regulatory factor
VFLSIRTLDSGAGAWGSFPAIVQYEDNPPVLRCSGDEVRATQSRRRRAFSRALCAKRDVVIDLTELAFADASLMLDIAMLARRLRSVPAQLLVRGAQPQVRQLIERVGLHRLPGVNIEPAPAFV